MLRALDDLLGADRMRMVFPDWLEAKFDQESGPRQARALLRSMPRLVLIYNAFIIVDMFVLPETLKLAAILHAIITPAIMIVAWMLQGRLDRLPRDILGAIPSLLMVLQVSVVYLASTSPDSSHYLYFILIIAICSNASLPMSYRSASWISGASWLLTAATIALGRHMTLAVAAMLMLTLIVVTYVTLLTNFQRNMHIRRAYLIDLRNRLRVEAIGKEARNDALTGLANRRRLDEAAAELWARGDASVSPVSIILFDVDRFKAYNDIYGHQKGDACLKMIASRAPAEAGGADDIAARYGGEEFMLLLPRTGLEEARAAAERMRRAIAELEIPHEGGELGVATASFGVAAANVSATSFDVLTAAADAALYAAKRSGRNRVNTALHPARTRSSHAA